MPPLLLHNLIDGGNGNFNADGIVVKNAGTAGVGTLQLIGNILRAYGSSGNPLKVEDGEGKLRLARNAMTGGNPNCWIWAEYQGVPGCRTPNSLEWDRLAGVPFNYDTDCGIMANYHLPFGSSCIDSGGDLAFDGGQQGYDGSPFVDIDGTMRPLGSTYDIGPDEFVP